MSGGVARICSTHDSAETSIAVVAFSLPILAASWRDCVECSRVPSLLILEKAADGSVQVPASPMELQLSDGLVLNASMVLPSYREASAPAQEVKVLTASYTDLSLSTPVAVAGVATPVVVSTVNVNNPSLRGTVVLLSHVRAGVAAVHTAGIVVQGPFNVTRLQAALDTEFIVTGVSQGSLDIVDIKQTTTTLLRIEQVSSVNRTVAFKVTLPTTTTGGVTVQRLVAAVELSSDLVPTDSTLNSSALTTIPTEGNTQYLLLDGRWRGLNAMGTTWFGASVSSSGLFLSRIPLSDCLSPSPQSTPSRTSSRTPPVSITPTKSRSEGSTASQTPSNTPSTSLTPSVSRSSTPSTSSYKCVTDGVKNSVESDVDCGYGVDCMPCQVGMRCVTSDDCALPYLCRSPANVCVDPRIVTLGAYVESSIVLFGVSKSASVTTSSDVMASLNAAIATTVNADASSVYIANIDTDVCDGCSCAMHLLLGAV